MTAISTEIRADLRAEIDRLEGKCAENPSGRYFVPLANAYRRAGAVDRAITVLDEGIAAHPDYVSARVMLGRCLADQERVDAAEDAFRQVLSADPRNLVAVRSLGELAVRAGDQSGVRHWYTRVLEIDPGNEEARLAIVELTLLDAPEVPAGLLTAPDDEPSASDPADAAGNPETSADSPSPVLTQDSSGTEETAVSASDGEAVLDGEVVEEPAPVDEAGLPVVEPALEAEAASAVLEVDTSSASDLSAPEPEPALATPSVSAARDVILYDGEEILVTETIAELYTRQGVYDRAILVYRELIRGRGEAPRLMERLERVERLAGGFKGAAAPERRTADIRVEAADPAAEEAVAPAAEALDAPSGGSLTVEETLIVEVELTRLSDGEVHVPLGVGEGLVSASVALPDEWTVEADPVSPASDEALDPLMDLPVWHGEALPEVSSENDPAPLARNSGTTGSAVDGVGDDSFADPFSPFMQGWVIAERESSDVVPEQSSGPSFANASASAPDLPDDDLFPWEIPLVVAPSLPSAELPSDLPAAASSDPTDPSSELFPGSGDESDPTQHHMEENSGVMDLSELSSVPGSADGSGHGALLQELTGNVADTDMEAEPAVSLNDTDPVATAVSAVDVAGDASSNDNDDDDIESFQAWLRSLKR
ncbi:MAG: tetratricopeptide repeat protein [Gemmatimonadota bacterium]|jgi:tetratricopeptide (TPR) repeat protein|nr:tetratricopeptide repeat protein [Gemmatimonadota bacterium]